MAPPKLTLYVDFVSPFTYLAYHALRHDPIFSQFEKTYIPVFLAGIMKACGNTTPLNIMNKGQYIAKQRLHFASLYSIPTAPYTPDGFPHLTLTVQRALTAITIFYPSEQEKITKALDVLFHTYHVECDARFTKDVGVLTEVLTKGIGREHAERVVGMVGEGRVKEMLMGNTERAVEEGAFALPWFVGEREMERGMGRRTEWG